MDKKNLYFVSLNEENVLCWEARFKGGNIRRTL